MDSPSPATDRPFYRLLEILGRTDDPIRLCVAEPFQVIRSLYRATDVDDAVRAFTAAGKSVWFEINNAPNVVGGRTAETDVVRLSALYADIDFKGAEGAKQGMGSEPAALELMQMLSGALGVAPAAIIWTGHGIQPYWPIADGNIDDINQQDIINLSKRWGILVQEMARSEGGAVDNIFDLARIFRAPGSTNFKNPEKPIPTRWEFPPLGNLPLTVDEISEILDAHGIRHPDTAETAGAVVSPPSEWAFADVDCPHHAMVMDGLRITPASRHHWLLQQATVLTAMIRYGCVTKETFRHYRLAITDHLKTLLADPTQPRPYNEYEVESAFRRALLNVQAMSDAKVAEEMRRHPHRTLRLIADADDAFDRGEKNIRIVNQSLPTDPEPYIATIPAPPGLSAILGNNVVELRPKPEPASLQVSNEFAYSDSANADRLAIYLDDEYIFVPDDDWYRWEDGRYVRDSEKTIMERAKESLIAFRRAYPTVDAVQKHVLKSLSAGGVRASVAMAQSLPALVVPPHMLDNHPYDLPTPGGVVNLRDGSIRQAQPRRDLNTMRTTVTPDATHPIPRWLAFLDFVLAGDRDMIAYLQRVIGATLIGEVRFHILPILTGTGRNGKSTLLSILEKILGIYAKRMAEDFLIETHHKEHPEEIARLRGVRFGVASEAKANGRFAEARVKGLTGEKTLTGRFMGQNSFDFRNSVTLWLAVNHLPAVASGGDGFWRRIRVFQFKGKVEQEIPDLDEQLVNEEGPGILAWMIAGAVEAINHGLQDPPSVMAATKEYAVQEDHLAQWVADNLMVVPDVGAMREEVYQRYARWAERNRLIVLTKSVFDRELRHYIDINEYTSTPKIFGGIALTKEEVLFGPFAQAPNVPILKHPVAPTPASVLFDYEHSHEGDDD